MEIYKFKKLFIIVLLFATIVSCKKVPKPLSSDYQYAVPNLIGQKQEKDLWCAAAAARMLMSQKTNSLPTQCQIVSRVTGNLCVNQKIDSEIALIMYGYSVAELPISFDTVVNSINENKPVIIYHYNRKGTLDESGHAVVAYGTFNTQERNYILVYDPLTDNTVTMDSSYVTGNLEWYRVLRIN